MNERQAEKQAPQAIPHPKLVLPPSLAAQWPAQEKQEFKSSSVAF